MAGSPKRSTWRLRASGLIYESAPRDILADVTRASRKYLRLTKPDRGESVTSAKSPTALVRIVRSSAPPTPSTRHLPPVVKDSGAISPAGLGTRSLVG